MPQKCRPSETRADDSRPNSAVPPSAQRHSRARFGFSGQANAQTNERIYEGLNFRFVTPGARAVGMGVTFIGLADDATAAASESRWLVESPTAQSSRSETIRSGHKPNEVGDGKPPTLREPRQQLQHLLARHVVGVSVVREFRAAH